MLALTTLVHRSRMHSGWLWFVWCAYFVFVFSWGFSFVLIRGWLYSYLFFCCEKSRGLFAVGTAVCVGVCVFFFFVMRIVEYLRRR